MSQYLLDTNICVHFLKNEHHIAQQIARVGFGNCYLSELTIAELLFGVANSAPTRQAANRQAVEELRETFAERVLLIDWPRSGVLCPAESLTAPDRSPGG